MLLGEKKCNQKEMQGWATVEVRLLARSFMIQWHSGTEWSHNSRFMDDLAAKQKISKNEDMLHALCNGPRNKSPSFGQRIVMLDQQEGKSHWHSCHPQWVWELTNVDKHCTQQKGSSVLLHVRSWKQQRREGGMEALGNKDNLFNRIFPQNVALIHVIPLPRNVPQN